LEPAVVHQYCEMMLARAVPVVDVEAEAATVINFARHATKPLKPVRGNGPGKAVGRARVVAPAAMKPAVAPVVRAVPRSAKPVGQTPGKAVAKLVKRKATGTDRPRMR
jgi:hypothetical protein